MDSNRRNGFFVFAVGLIALAALPHPILGQAKVAQTPQIIVIAISADKDKGAEVKEIDLRPNTPTELGFDLRNNAGEVLGDVTLKVVQVANGQDRVLAQTTIPKLEPTPAMTQGFVVQMFDKIKGAPEMLELTGSPPFILQVQLQGKNLPLVKREIKLVIREPRDYVSPTLNFNRGEGSLSVVVKPNEGRTFIGQHLLPVQLILGPDIKPSKKGLFKQSLTRPMQQLALAADEIAFERLLTEGDVYLRVDGYDRAFTYTVKESATGPIEARPAGEIRVRIGAPRYSRPNAKFDVPLEIDGPLSPDFKVRVGLDRTGDTDDPQGTDLLEFVGLRRQTASLSVSKEGKLVCQADVRDWQAQFDTGDIFGRTVKVRVNVIKDKEKVKLAVAPESRPLLARQETDDREKDIKSIFVKVTVDESAPESLKLDLPKDPTTGEPLEIRTGIKARKSSQAPIARIVVFRGKAPKDDKEDIKADDILAVESVVDATLKEWKFTLPAQDKAESFPLSVQFITHTGVKATITELLNLKLGAATKKLFTIKGNVLRGSLGQPGLEVTLLDAKKNVKGTAKTNDKGAFVFENVEPGAYVVTSTVSVQNLVGTSLPFNVPDPKKKELDVTVSLLTK